LELSSVYYPSFGLGSFLAAIVNVAVEYRSVLKGFAPMNEISGKNSSEIFDLGAGNT
jgi:hypothetical protein